MTLQGITEDEIANYLVHTPGFFERNAQLLASIQLTSPHGQRAVSLQERQMEMLRDKIRGLEKRIMEMIRHSQENEAIADRLHRWVRATMLAHDNAALPEVLVETLRHEFLIPQVAVRVWGTAEQALRAEVAALPCADTVSEDARSFAASLGQPYCGLNSGFEASKWLEDSAHITSLALIPLHHGGECYGLLVLGSPDATRYTADMGVDFLLQVGDIASAAMARLLSR
ncbi:DUF484 family protein [Aquabacterium sp.]|jgi:uncharacterized protein|uniref:DUF484 family protein n=1 Tax=Aquabacterium sp. TaxID=1872578 RepID=UPI00248A3B1D|nr:DUF484 family protein [Aquabacterium sp.]MDI1349024.1 DUF484 family protein [Aquabacterium sp.]